MLKTLTLPIKKKWFDLIISGEKKEEYRKLSNYYHVRFSNLFNGSNHIKREIILRNGYSKSSKTCVIVATLEIGEGKEEWGAVKGEGYYILVIHGVKLSKEVKKVATLPQN